MVLRLRAERPEDLELAGSGRGVGGAGVSGGARGSGGALLTGDVRIVEMLGSELHVFFSTDAPAAGASALAATAGEAEAGLLAGAMHNDVARIDPRSGVRPGQRVTFRVDPGRLHFFDPDTGTAIRWPATLRRRPAHTVRPPLQPRPHRKPGYPAR